MLMKPRDRSAAMLSRVEGAIVILQDKLRTLH